MQQGVFLQCPLQFHSRTNKVSLSHITAVMMKSEKKDFHILYSEIGERLKQNSSSANIGSPSGQFQLVRGQITCLELSVHVIYVKQPQHGINFPPYSQIMTKPIVLSFFLSLSGLPNQMEIQLGGKRTEPQRAWRTNGRQRRTHGCANVFDLSVCIRAAK